jgi:hypothetical protein
MNNYNSQIDKAIAKAIMIKAVNTRIEEFNIQEGFDEEAKIGKLEIEVDDDSVNIKVVRKISGNSCWSSILEEIKFEA